MCLVMVGDLNAVAPFITLWFLTCCDINIACAYLGYESHPSFRPAYRLFKWQVSLVGCCVCFFIMFYTQPLSALGALAAAAYYINTSRRSQEQVPQQHTVNSRSCTRESLEHGQRVRLGDGDDVRVAGAPPGPSDWRSGSRFKTARTAMLALGEGDLQFKYWRPFVLFLCAIDGDANYVRQRGMLDALAQLVRRGKGLALVNGVVVDEVAEPSLRKARKARRRLRALLRDRGVQGFADVVVAPSREEGRKLLLQAKGLGYFRPNTVALGWPTETTGTREASCGPWTTRRRC